MGCTRSKPSRTLSSNYLFPSRLAPLREIFLDQQDRKSPPNLTQEIPDGPSRTPKKKKSPTVTELNRLKRELKLVRDRLECREGELAEALEHQTATSEVLGIISRSPTDVQPVLDAIVESAARVCGIDDVVLRLREGNTLVPRAHFGPIPIGPSEISMDEPQHRWMREHGTLHIPDARVQNDFPNVRFVGVCAHLSCSFRFVSKGNLLER